MFSYIFFFSNYLSYSFHGDSKRRITTARVCQWKVSQSYRPKTRTSSLELHFKTYIILQLFHQRPQLEFQRAMVSLWSRDSWPNAREKRPS